MKTIEFLLPITVNYNGEEEMKEVTKMIYSKFIDFFNSRTKMLDIYDLKMVQGAAMCLILIIAKIYPRLMDVNIWWFVCIGLLMLIRPCYVFLIKR